MYLRKICGRILSAAVKSDHGGPSAAASTSVRNPLEQFFEVDRTADDDKRLVYGTFILSTLPFRFNYVMNLTGAEARSLG